MLTAKGSNMKAGKRKRENRKRREAKKEERPREKANPQKRRKKEKVAAILRDLEKDQVRLQANQDKRLHKVLK